MDTISVDDALDAAGIRDGKKVKNATKIKGYIRAKDYQNARDLFKRTNEAVLDSLKGKPYSDHSRQSIDVCTMQMHTDVPGSQMLERRHLSTRMISRISCAMEHMRKRSSGLLTT